MGPTGGACATQFVHCCRCAIRMERYCVRCLLYVAGLAGIEVTRIYFANDNVGTSSSCRLGNLVPEMARNLKS